MAMEYLNLARLGPQLLHIVWVGGDTFLSTELPASGAGALRHVLQPGQPPPHVLVHTWLLEGRLGAVFHCSPESAP